jgi:hypothetical protein
MVKKCYASSGVKPSERIIELLYKNAPDLLKGDVTVQIIPKRSIPKLTAICQKLPLEYSRLVINYAKLIYIPVDLIENTIVKKQDKLLNLLLDRIATFQPLQRKSYFKNLTSSKTLLLNIVILQKLPDYALIERLIQLGADPLAEDGNDISAVLDFVFVRKIY